MKEIKAIIQPFMLPQVLDGLRQIANLPGITVSQVHGYSIMDADIEAVTKTKLELMVTEDLVRQVVDSIRTHAHTGNQGDGRIFVIPVEETTKIRTGETGTIH